MSFTPRAARSKSTEYGRSKRFPRPRTIADLLLRFRDPPRALIPGTTVATPVVAWSTPPAAVASSTVSAVPAEADHTQLPETSIVQPPATSTALADSLGSESQSPIEPSVSTNAVLYGSAVAASAQDSQHLSAGDRQSSAPASSSMQEETTQSEPNASTKIMGTSAQDSQHLNADDGQPSTPASGSKQEKSSQQPSSGSSTNNMSTSAQNSQHPSVGGGQAPVPASSNVQEESSQRPTSDASTDLISTSMQPSPALILTETSSSYPLGSPPTTTVVAYQGSAAAFEISTAGTLIGLLCYALLA